MVVGVPRIPRGKFVGLEYNADIVLKFDQNRVVARVILSNFLLPPSFLKKAQP